jgi:hypothetical protein
MLHKILMPVNFAALKNNPGEYINEIFTIFNPPDAFSTVLMRLSEN